MIVPNLDYFYIKHVKEYIKFVMIFYVDNTLI